MKYYIIKCTSVATENNFNFRGETDITFFGKGQRELAHLGTHAESTGSKRELSDYMVREYGYSRKCDAVRSWIYNNPENSEFWKFKCEIVEVEI